MPLELTPDAPTLLIRRAAFERSGLSRARLDERLNLTDEEFRVERDLIAIGPLHGETSLTDLTDELESLGLTYFDDFFEMSGNWPSWLRVHTSS